MAQHLFSKQEGPSRSPNTKETSNLLRPHSQQSTVIFSRLPHHPILCYSCQLPQGLPKNPPAPRARGSVSTFPPVPNADLPVLAHPSSLPPVDPLSTLASPSSLLSVSSQHQETLPTQAHHGCTWQDLRSIPCQATNPQLPHSPGGGQQKPRD